MLKPGAKANMCEWSVNTCRRSGIRLPCYSKSKLHNIMQNLKYLISFKSGEKPNNFNWIINTFERSGTILLCSWKI